MATDMITSTLQPVSLRMADDPLLRDIVQKIVAAFDPRRIILFGSRARGDHHLDSDLDLFVEMETDLHPVKRRTQIRNLLWPPQCSMDILVYTPAEVASRRGVIGSIVCTIEREGNVLYEQTGA